MYFIPVLITKGKKEQQEKKAFEIANNLLQNFSLDNPNFKIIELNKASIGIEDIQQVRNQLKFKPFSDKYTVIYIPDFDKATTQAQNAMLKILEEPTENIQIILSTINYRKLLPTILSRCINMSLEVKSTKLGNPTLEADKFTQMDIKEKFDYIIEMFDKKKSKDSRELKQRSLDLVDELIEKFSINIADNHKVVLKLLKYKNYLEANVNRRLVLENIVLEMDPPNTHTQR